MIKFMNRLICCDDGASLVPARTMYMSCVKHLLGVRRTTTTDLCLIEIGLPSLAERVKKNQLVAITKLVDNRRGMEDDVRNKAQWKKAQCAKMEKSPIGIKPNRKKPNGIKPNGKKPNGIKPNGKKPNAITTHDADLQKRNTSKENSQ